MSDQRKFAHLNLILKDDSQYRTRQYALIIIIITTIVYSNIFQAPFIFDDEINITKNPSLMGRPSLFSVFTPPSETSLESRPVINFTLAINYAISGLRPWSYHLFNILIHLCAALFLLGIIRRTFLLSAVEPYMQQSTSLAFAASLIWAIHPLQTQSVTYIIQRCESLMGLFFLMVFYYAIRGWQAKKQTAWHLVAVLAFLFGVGSKEVIVVAPVLLLCYDCIYVHRYPHIAIRRSPLLYSGLALGLIVLGFHVILGGISSLPNDKFYSVYEYWRTQPKVILHYIRLMFWPSPLSFDYGWPIASWPEAWPTCVIFSGLIIYTVRAIFKRYFLGFPAAWFFLILSPTMIIPLAIAYEHRVYLPLAAIVILTLILIVEIDRIILKYLHNYQSNYVKLYQSLKWFAFILVCFSLCFLTSIRNKDYKSAVSIWKDAAEKYPENSRAHANLGQALMRKGMNKDAMAALNEALRIEVQNARLYSLSVKGDQEMDDRIHHYLSVRRIYGDVKNNMGLISFSQGDTDTALRHFQEALRMNPGKASAQSNIGLALINQGRTKEAIKAFNEAIAIDPNFSEAYVNLGALLRIDGRLNEAAYYFKQAIDLMPNNSRANFGLAMVLHQLNKNREAVIYLRKALRTDPNFEPARKVLKQIQTKMKLQVLSDN